MPSGAYSYSSELARPPFGGAAGATVGVLIGALVAALAEAMLERAWLVIRAPLEQPARVSSGTRSGSKSRGNVRRGWVYFVVLQ